MPHRQKTPRPSMIRFKNIQMLVVCSLVHRYSSLGPDVRRLYSGHSKRVVCCNRNILRNYEYVIQIWSLIACYVENFQAVFSRQNYPQKPGRKLNSFNYGFFRCTVQGKSPPGRKQEYGGGAALVGHLKNVIFKSWQLQLILHWFMNLYITYLYTYVCACVHKLPLFFH